MMPESLRTGGRHDTKMRAQKLFGSTSYHEIIEMLLRGARGGSESENLRGTTAASCDWSILFSAEKGNTYHVTKPSTYYFLLLSGQ